MKKTIILALVLATTAVKAQFKPTFNWAEKVTTALPASANTYAKANETIAGVAMEAIDPALPNEINQYRRQYTAINYSFYGSSSSKPSSKIIEKGTFDGKTKAVKDYAASNSSVTSLKIKDIAFGGVYGDIPATDGELVVAGEFMGVFKPDFEPVGQSYLSSTSTAKSSIFLAKYDAKYLLMWAKKINFTSEDLNFKITKIKMNPYNGEIYVLGISAATTTQGIVSYFSKFDDEGNLAWTKTITSTKGVLATDIDFDSEWNAYVVGTYTGTVDFGRRVTLTGSTTTSTAFLVKYKIDELIPDIKPVFAKKVSTNHSADIPRVLVEYGRVHVVSPYMFNTVVAGTTSLTAGKGSVYWARYSSTSGYFQKVQAIERGSNVIGYRLNDIGIDASRNIYICYKNDANGTFINKYKRSTATTTTYVKVGAKTIIPDPSELPSATPITSRLIISSSPQMGYEMYLISNFDQRLVLDIHDSDGNFEHIFSPEASGKGVETIFAKWSKSTNSNRLIGGNDDEDFNEELVIEEDQNEEFVATESNITIFPNPAVDNIQLNLLNTDELATINIMDVTGKLVKQIVNYTNTATIDLTDLSQGVYVLTVEQAGETTRKQLVKQ